MIIEIKNLPNQPIAEIDVNIKFLQNGTIETSTETTPNTSTEMILNDHPENAFSGMDTEYKHNGEVVIDSESTGIERPSVDSFEGRPHISVPQEMTDMSF